MRLIVWTLLRNIIRSHCSNLKRFEADVHISLQQFIIEVLLGKIRIERQQVVILSGGSARRHILAESEVCARYSLFSFVLFRNPGARSCIVRVDSLPGPFI